MVDKKIERRVGAIKAQDIPTNVKVDILMNMNKILTESQKHRTFLAIGAIPLAVGFLFFVPSATLLLGIMATKYVGVGWTLFGGANAWSANRCHQDARYCKQQAQALTNG